MTEMLDLAGAGKWEEAATVARIGRIHRVSPSFFDWAETVAAAHLRLDAPARRRTVDWQPELVLEVDKDSNTDWREMEAACGANLLREACRILTQVKERGPRTLVSDGNDDQRLMSWPVALAELTAAHPDLLKTLRTEFAPEARLELRRALDDQDVRSLATLVLRYDGTDEAAEAHSWLGDRSLLDGEPALASAQYREALRMAQGKELRDRIQDRLQLTAALLGQALAAPVEKDIEFGTTRLSPAALEALRKKRAEQGADSRTRLSLPPQSAPFPTAFEVVSHGQFEGEMGDKSEITPPLPPSQRRLDIDWFARQVALTVDGNRLLVSNRFQVSYPVLTNFDTPNGDASCVRRARSNTPLQALTTLNETLFLECARGLAQKTLAEGGASDRDRIVYAFRRCTGRKPTDREKDVLLAFLEKQIKKFSAADARPWELAANDPSHLPALPQGTQPAQAAAWTALARLLLNLDETITKE